MGFISFQNMEEQKFSFLKGQFLNFEDDIQLFFFKYPLFNLEKA